jgi:S1-C subfamily serine protease
MSQENDALDAYSKAVVGAVDEIGPAVVSINVGRRGWMGQGAGSGVLVAPDGYLVTNAHVVDGATRIHVDLVDGRTLEGRVVGKDAPSDLAVVRISTDNRSLPWIKMGTSTLRVGQLVIAIGNPFGFSSTVSTGVVSSLGRSLRGHEGRLVENLVQHTAPLNPGNSGGPLVDFRAELVGINTAMIHRAQGLSFAIPSQTVSWIVPRLIADGRVRRAYLGIQGHTRVLETRVLRALDLDGHGGVHVAGVEQNGPAARSGVEAGDVIIRGAGKRLEGIDDLLRLLGDYPAREKLDLELVRRAEKRSLAVITGEA